MNVEATAEKDRIIIDGLGKPYDGEWELEIGSLDMRELNMLKIISGLRAGQIEDALFSIDVSLVVGLAAIALTRYGVNFDIERLWDAKSGQLKYRLAPEAEEELPDPTQEPAPDSETSNASSDGSPTTSGGASTTDSAQQENGHSPTGTPPSDTSATSDPVTSAT